jgi:hypothetical protein
MINIKYRINDLELRTTKRIDNTYYLEIVKWRKETNGLADAYCFTIASFTYDKDGYPELHYCGSRPLELDSNELVIFHKLIKEGYNYRINEDNELIYYESARNQDKVLKCYENALNS